MCKIRRSPVINIFFPHLASSSKIISLYKTGSCDSSSFMDRVQQNRKYFNRISRPKMRSCFCVVYTTPHFCSNFPPLPSWFFFDDQLLKILCMKAHCLQQNLAYILMLLAVHLLTLGWEKAERKIDLLQKLCGKYKYNGNLFF